MGSLHLQGSISVVKERRSMEPSVQNFEQKKQSWEDKDKEEKASEDNNKEDKDGEDKHQGCPL